MHANGNFAYINGKIYTCDDENRYAQAMTVQDGVITWVGAQEDLPPEIGPLWIWVGNV